MTEVTYEYTYMRPDGYPDDFAGLPSLDVTRAEEVSALFPGEGVIFKRIISGPWIEVES